MLGDLSARYESNGNPGTISNGWGDAGGKSYGAYQLASAAGSVKSFLRWAIISGNDVYAQYSAALSQYEIGSEDFDTVWRDIANNDGETFFNMQHDYICYAYYLPSVQILRDNYYDIDKHNSVMQDVVWSRAVQYGTGNILEMFTDAVHSLGYDNLSYVDDPKYDADMIKAIYLNVCKTSEWTSGSPSLREGLYNRFENECADALAQL